MRRAGAPGLAAGVVVSVLVALAPRSAAARLIDARAGIRAGGLTGWGATSSTPDFFDSTRGAAYGFEVGVKLLVFDVSANFLQVIGSNGRTGTLTRVLGGFILDAPIGPGHSSEEKNRLILHPGIDFGFAFGTPHPVSPPLDSAQVSHKGLVTQLLVGLEYFFNPYLAIGAEVSGGYHYFFGGTIETTSDGANKSFSHGTHLIGLATLTFHLGR
ncbi:MAG TPA: hypothetical protein VMU50_11975 [Polyangia bacterium]|nr:hypothetical protein [Polyangia bacterium]